MLKQTLAYHILPEFLLSFPIVDLSMHLFRQLFGNKPVLFHTPSLIIKLQKSFPTRATTH